MRLRIAEISENDAYFQYRDILVGIIGDFSPNRSSEDGWFSGSFEFENGFRFRGWPTILLAKARFKIPPRNAQNPSPEIQVGVRPTTMIDLGQNSNPARVYFTNYFSTSTNTR